MGSEGKQEGGWMSQGSSDKEGSRQEQDDPQAVPEKARRGGETQPSWVEPNAWTDSMLEALREGRGL